MRSRGRNAGVLAELFWLHSPPTPTDARRSMPGSGGGDDDGREKEHALSLSCASLTALVDAVLVARDLPELGSDLVAALAGLEGHDLAHGGEEEKEEEEVESAEKGGGKE